MPRSSAAPKRTKSSAIERYWAAIQSAERASGAMRSSSMRPRKNSAASRPMRSVWLPTASAVSVESVVRSSPSTYMRPVVPLTLAPTQCQAASRSTPSARA